MASPPVQVYPDLEAMSIAAAGIFATAVAQAAKGGSEAWIAVSGGSTPTRLFGMLASAAWRDVIPWHAVRICQVDERPVPPDHPESNYRTLKETLLDHVPLSAESVVRIPAELGPTHAAELYESTLRERVPVGPNGFPALHLVLLGMGDDGHTASLFPYSPGLAESERWAIANPVAKLGAARITVTFPVLNSAGEVIFLVSGASKAAALAQVLHGAQDVAEFPAKGIRPAGGRLTWLIDAAAASCLSGAV